MNDPKNHMAGEAPGVGTGDAEVRARFERLRALRSAWGALAPSGLSVRKQAIADTGRALSESLAELGRGSDPAADRAAIVALDSGLDELEREMRDVALGIPVAQLRSTLPKQLEVDRRGVLDLLDLVLSAEVAGIHGIEARIPTLDYLITLLCTGGNPDAPLQDPVMLTPRLHALCERAAADPDPRLPDLEAEFFAAADLQRADVREEVELRKLRQRKVELGSAFFSPRVLRPILTYNATLLRRIDEEVSISQDWGRLPGNAAPEEPTSVFETTVLPRLAEALRRRAAGGAPESAPLDRIAWCLDLANLTRSEREALLSESTGRREGLNGTAILAGLLQRSAGVLNEEYPEIGISPDQLSDRWIPELDAAVRQEVNRRITGDDYDGACTLSELKSRFLSGASSTVRKNRVRSAEPVRPPIRAEAEPGPQPQPQKKRAASDPQPKPTATRGVRDWPWARIARAGAGGVLTFGSLVMLNTIFFEKGQVATAELAEISAFLSSGKRSDEGTGPAFVGTLDEEWFVLEEAEKAAAAELMVEALRERGVREIMVYDDDGQLRVQALGGQSVRVVPGGGEG